MTPAHLQPGLKARLAFLLTASLALAGCVSSTSTSEKGVVLAAVPTDQPGHNTGAGAIAGAVIGGVAGGQVGEGAGQVLAIAGGVLAGELAGSATEAALQHHDGIAYTIRLDDGRVLTILQHLNDGDPLIRPGAPILLQTDGSDQHVVPAAS